LDCGTIRKKFDVFATVVGIVGLLLLPLSWLAIEFFEPSTVLTVIFAIIPLSVASDAVFMAIKRRATHKTAAALFLGIIGCIIGLVSLIYRVITI